MSFGDIGFGRNKLKAREFSEVEAAWLGAYIQADGSAFIRKSTIRGDQPIVVVSQNEVEIISACLRITQTGHVQIQHPSRLSRNIGWFWLAGAYNDALYIAQRCAPYSMKCQRLVAGLRG